MSEPAVEIKGVTRRYGSFTALAEVSFSIPAGSIFGLLGPNGAGKTTLFSMIAGFLRADAGSIRVLGIDVRDPDAIVGRVGILPQDAEFQRDVPILDQLVFFERLAGTPRAVARERVSEALARVGLADFARRGAQVLSHGMRKRLGIVQALLGRPSVVLLDEPTAGLDPQNARQVRELIRELRGPATVVVSSHNLLEIQDLADQIAILDKGRLIAAGPVGELTRSGLFFNIELPRALTSDELRALAAIPGVVQVVSTAAQSLRIEVGDSSGERIESAVLRALLDRQLVPRAISRGHSLEETFLALTGESDAATSPGSHQ